MEQLASGGRLVHPVGPGGREHPVAAVVTVLGEDGIPSRERIVIGRVGHGAQGGAQARRPEALGAWLAAGHGI